jgi:hypothetical protein
MIWDSNDNVFRINMQWNNGRLKINEFHQFIHETSYVDRIFEIKPNCIKKGLSALF